MLGKKSPKPSVKSINFEDIEKFKKTITISGPQAAILQNLLVNTIRNRPIFEKLVEDTGGKGIQETMDLITELQEDIMKFVGMEIKASDKTSIGEIYGSKS